MGIGGYRVGLKLNETVPLVRVREANLAKLFATQITFSKYQQNENPAFVQYGN